MRSRRTSTIQAAVSADQITSEQYIRAFGLRYGWELAPYNVMFEGTTDVAHLEIANNLYVGRENRTLIDNAFKVWAIGVGNEGGTEGMLERLRLLAETLRIFPIEDEGRRIRVICVFDDDNFGRGAFRTMSGKFAKWRDIFLLRRKYPRSILDPIRFESETNKLNEAYLADKKFFCEIEDLLSRSIIEEFVKETRNCLQRKIYDLADGFHCDFARFAKGKLVEFVDSRATFDDVGRLVDLLKSLRSLFGLDADGSPVS